MNNKQTIIVERPILKIGVRNLNGRIYEMESAEKIVNWVNEKIKTLGCFFGELDHPSEMVVSLKNVSHDTKEVYIKDDILFGKFEILDTEKGNKLRETLEKTVFRPRMSGVVNEDGTVIVKQIFSFDAIKAEDDSFKGIL